MAKGELPNFAAKQKLLHSKDQTPESQVAVGDRFFEAGQLYDALDFFTQASNDDGIARVRDRAVSDADPLLLKLVLRRIEGEAPSEEWRTLGQNALENGKKLCAEEAFRMAGDWQTVARLRGEVAAEEREAMGEEDLEDEESDEDDDEDPS